MRRRQFLLLTSAAAFHLRPRQGTAQALQVDARIEELSGLISAKMAEHGIPGVAFGVLKSGQLATRGFGVTNLGDALPVTAETIFPIASISKTVATTAIMNLVRQGVVDIEAPVRQYLPDFRVQDEGVSREVRIWHLLTHTPGWEGQLPTPDRGTESLASFTAGLRDLPQLAAPGEVWSYNNAGFGVAGRVIEVVSQSTIADALRELVFAPLRLTRAFARTGDVVTYRFAAGHRQSDAGQTEVIRNFELPANVTAGGVAMSVADLLSYARFHLGDGRGADGGEVVPRALLEQMRTPRLRKNSTEDEMGLGWQLRRIGGVMTAMHGGTLGGHCLHLQIVPERNLAFAILTNQSNGWRLIQDVERATLRLYEGLSLSLNQRIGHRGVNEDMTGHASPLATQPDISAYVGTYIRPPLGVITAQEEGGRLVINGSGTGPFNTTITFYAQDVAFATAGSYTGMPFEFVRDAGGSVRWMRVNGRIARKSTG
ncbi:MAG: serine hydrolase [Gemmatimonadetes bacterium]|nr:serine hydrolase [Gemmatimonadota bacterium]